EQFIATGIKEGATLACGGKRPANLPKGFYVEQTLFTNARNDMTVAREEIFGPVVTAIPFDDEAQAIALANDSDYGLYGYVWSGDSARGLRVARALRTGTAGSTRSTRTANRNTSGGRHELRYDHQERHGGGRLGTAEARRGRRHQGRRHHGHRTPLRREGDDRRRRARRHAGHRRRAHALRPAG